MTTHYFKIAPKAPLFQSYTYKSSERLEPGQRVKIPLGSRKVNGLVIEQEHLKNVKPIQKIKAILDKDKNHPPLGSQRVRWLQWMSSYYHYPLGLIADLNFSPKRSFKQKDLLSSPSAQSKPSYLSMENNQQPSSISKDKKAFVTLNWEQQACAKKILQSQGFHVHLIHGVTGSGKTEIYKTLIAQALSKDLQALVLLPEIFLTPQIVGRFAKSFPGEIALLHSQISLKEKSKVWQELLNEKKRLLVGTRSALFCPLPKLGLIIIDEEHDSSFKQESKFRYHARDAAIVLAKQLNIPIVLGSATPDFSSYKKALDGSYQLYELKKRAFQQTLPKVTVVDLKKEVETKAPFWLSKTLREKMEKTLKKGKQVALFVNRRGLATALFCSGCGHTRQCLNCDISLTLHKEQYLLCHYCSYLEQKPSHCPSCKSREWLEMGFGTQAVQKVIEKTFPHFKTLRADRDSINSKEEMDRFVDIVEKKQAHIIIGTQMISKGLNFPSIYLVGLILADMDFNLPDFRAGERAFQTLLQMAGRAGREDFGEVVLQTFHPNHSAISFSKQHDYKGFFHKEIKSRKKWSYPPFSRLCLLKMDCLKESEGQSFSKQIAKKVRELAHPGIKILGPSPAPLFKIKNRYRFQILIKGENHKQLSSFLETFFERNKRPSSSVQIKVDRDPFSML